MKTGAKKIGLGLVLMMAMSTLFRCAPIASEMQSARLAGKGQVEVTPQYSEIHFRQVSAMPDESKNTEVKGHLLGLQAAYGVTNTMDMRLRVEQIRFRGNTQYVFSVGPKFSLVRDRIALFVPIWFVDAKPAQTQPTLVFTLPVIRNKVEFNPSAKTIISVSGYDPMNGLMIAFNAGFAISTDLSRWALRPEYSVVYDIKGGNRLGSFSLGLSLNLNTILHKGK
ncbi:MAG: hypothetical protein JNL40_14360 [Cyclobacteriaceae bacterium]|nr:hypothetical protein [Cyclobacteriaceae bacterium]